MRLHRAILLACCLTFVGSVSLPFSAWAQAGDGESGNERTVVEEREGPEDPDSVESVDPVGDSVDPVGDSVDREERDDAQGEESHAKLQDAERTGAVDEAGDAATAKSAEDVTEADESSVADEPREDTKDDLKEEASPGEVVVLETPIGEDDVPARAVVLGALGDATRDPQSGVHPRGGFLSEWDPTRPRWFMSARADAGFLFVRPRASAGYGLPHSYWAGLDVVPILSASQYGGYSGLRLKHPRAEIRSGALYSKAFFRGSFAPREHYDERDLDLQQEDPAEFLASDSELSLSIPLGKAFLWSETQVLYLLASDPGRYVFVDTVGVIAAAPWIAREQVGLTFPIRSLPGLFTGPAVETVWVPGRVESWTLRAGFVVRWRLYQDLEIRTDVLPNFISPDTLGRKGSSWLTIAARFLWATD